MESGIRSIFLVGARMAVGLSLLIATSVWAQEVEEPPQVIEPEVQRRELDVAAIDTEDFEITGFVGYMSVEDFESDAVYGARLAYHISQYLFAEASYGSTDVGESTAERLSAGVSLLGGDRDYTYYDASLGFNILLGESFLGGWRAWNSAFYLIGGVGNTDFGGDEEFTANLGFGFKVLPTDYIAIRFDARDYLFDTDVSGEDKTTHNFQMTLNLSWFF